MPSHRVKKFRGTLERLRSALGWVIVRIPFDVGQVWNSRGRLKVRGEINGFVFRTSLFPTRDEGHFILINKQMQKGGSAKVGSVVQIQMEPDLEKRVAAVPAELKKLMAGEKSFQGWFQKLNYSTRKNVADWINQVKSGDARQRRAVQIAERLLLTMEGERELPPILRNAFRNEPRAGDQWELLSPAQRRSSLMAIFYYRTPDARARRVQKVIDDLLDRADKRDEKRSI